MEDPSAAAIEAVDQVVSAVEDPLAAADQAAVAVGHSAGVEDPLEVVVALEEVAMKDLEEDQRDNSGREGLKNLQKVNSEEKDAVDSAIDHLAAADLAVDHLAAAIEAADQAASEAVGHSAEEIDHQAVADLETEDRVILEAAADLAVDHLAAAALDAAVNDLAAAIEAEDQADSAAAVDPLEAAAGHSAVAAATDQVAADLDAAAIDQAAAIEAADQAETEAIESHPL